MRVPTSLVLVFAVSTLCTAVATAADDLPAQARQLIASGLSPEAAALRLIQQGAYPEDAAAALFQVAPEPARGA